MSACGGRGGTQRSNGGRELCIHIYPSSSFHPIPSQSPAAPCSTLFYSPFPDIHPNPITRSLTDLILLGIVGSTRDARNISFYLVKYIRTTHKEHQSVHLTIFFQSGRNVSRNRRVSRLGYLHWRDNWDATWSRWICSRAILPHRNPPCSAAIP